jgi:hypothetical protein
MGSSIEGREPINGAPWILHWSTLETVTIIPRPSPLVMSSRSLQAAFERLMHTAPSPLFHRARSLYLNKYDLDGRDSPSPLRLFVLNEDVNERIEPRAEATEGTRMAILTIRATRLALVHWQQPHAATAKEAAAYFAAHWDLELPPLTPQAEPWFRNGGHQSWLEAPQDLCWSRRSPLPG